MDVVDGSMLEVFDAGEAGRTSEYTELEDKTKPDGEESSSARTPVSLYVASCVFVVQYPVHTSHCH